MKHKLVCILLRNPGKGIFCLLGLVSGLGAFGFILGFLLGYLVDEILHEKLILTFMMAFILSPDKKKHYQECLLSNFWIRTAALSAMSVSILAIRRPVSDAERTLLKHELILHLPVSGRSSGMVKHMVDRIPSSTNIHIRVLAENFSILSSEEEKRQALSLLLKLGHRDVDNLTGEQLEQLHTIASVLGVSIETFRTLRAEELGIYGDAYKILGISPDVSTAEIRRVYHILVSHFHPDHGTDLEGHQREEVHEAFLKIHHAYALIMEEREGQR